MIKLGMELQLTRTFLDYKGLRCRNKLIAKHWGRLQNLVKQVNPRFQNVYDIPLIQKVSATKLPRANLVEAFAWGSERTDCLFRWPLNAELTGPRRVSAPNAFTW